MTRAMVAAGVVLFSCLGCQNDPQPAAITQETILFVAGLEIPETGSASLTFPGVEDLRVYLEVDSIDLLAEPSFRVIRGDVECDAEVPDEDVIIDAPDDLRPGEAQDSFEPPVSDTYTLCFTDDNNAPGQTSYRVTITQDIR